MADPASATEVDTKEEDQIASLKEKAREQNGALIMNGSSNGGSSKSSDDEDANGENGNHKENGVVASDDSDVQMLSSAVTSTNPSPLPSTSKVMEEEESLEDESEDGDGDEDEDDEMEEIDEDDVEEVKDSSSDSDIMEIDADEKPDLPNKTNVVTIDNMETLRSLANDAKRRQEEAEAKTSLVDATSILSKSSSAVTITPTSSSSKPRFSASSLPPGLTISQTSNKANFSNILNRNKSPATATATPKQLNDPNLTDDTFVVEAPSFIVPYVYEKPPKETIKDFKASIDEIIKKGEEAKDKEDSPKKEDDAAAATEKKPEETAKPKTYFESVLGKFIMDLGMNLVQEHVQLDLLKEQQRRSQKDKSASVMHAILSLKKNLETSRETNKDFTYELIKCRFCSFKTESAAVMEHHLESPHLTRAGMVRCNFCRYEQKVPLDVANHMMLEHGISGRLDRMPAMHQCPQCPYEDNMKGKLTRHKVSCDKRFRNERNQEAPHDWEPPAKIPKPQVARGRSVPGSAGLMAAGMKQGMNQFQKSKYGVGGMPQLQFGPRGMNRPVGRQGMNFMGKGSQIMGQGKQIIFLNAF